MKCILCKKTWDDAAVITGQINLTTDDIPRSLSMENQPICAACIAGISKIMAENAAEAAVAIAKRRKEARDGPS